MASPGKNKKRIVRPIICVLIALLLVAAVVMGIESGKVPIPTSIPGLTYAPTESASGSTPVSTVTPATSVSTAAPNTAEKGLVLHVIDVGDGDCLLLQADGHNMLIDAGHSTDFPIINAYLEKVGARVFDFALATHPHEDHIGSMDQFIKKYKPGRMLLSPRPNNTKQYERMLDALIDAGIKPERPKPGDTFALGGATITVLAPIRDDYSQINDFSVVVRVDYGKTSFLLAGDAGKEPEADMLASGRDLSATVLKLGHHGSSSSTTKAFLQAVSPSVAVSSAARDVGVSKRLYNAGVPYYSTADVGTIVITSDGVKVTLTAARLSKPAVFSSSYR